MLYSNSFPSLMSDNYYLQINRRLEKLGYKFRIGVQLEKKGLPN